MPRKSYTLISEEITKKIIPPADATIASCHSRHSGLRFSSEFSKNDLEKSVIFELSRKKTFGGTETIASGEIGLMEFVSLFLDLCLFCRLCALHFKLDDEKLSPEDKAKHAPSVISIMDKKNVI